LVSVSDRGIRTKQGSNVFQWRESSNSQLQLRRLRSCSLSKKMAPSLGPRFKRLRIWWVMSGKAMQSTVPPAGTARVVTRRIEESEGHVAEFAASLLPRRDALAAPKLEPLLLAITFSHKQMTSKDLVGERRWVRRATAEITRKSKVQNNAYSMHSRTRTPQTPSPWRVLASHGLECEWKYLRSSCCRRRCAASPAESDREATDR
jgi:hypothetical protein